MSVASSTTTTLPAETVAQAYRHQTELLLQHVPDGADGFFAEHRLAALAAFEQQGFPGRKNEEWKYTPVAHLGRQAFPLAGAGQSGQHPSSWLPDWKANRLVFVNGVFQAEESEIHEPDTLGFRTIAEMVARDPDALATWFDALQHPGWSAFARLNSALYRDGAVIHLQAGAQLKYPVLLLDRSDYGAENALHFPRHLLIAEAGSAARIVHVQGNPESAEAAYRAFSVMEVFAEQDAQLQLDILQEGGEHYENIHAIDVRQDRGSHVATRTFSLAGKLIRNDLRVRFAAEHTTCDLQGLSLAAAQDLIDQHLLIDHACAHCESNQLYKGIADGDGQSVFNGKIFVRPNAQKTNAYQSNKNLLLSPTAHIYTKPQLEIFADDVRCSHGATSGQLDPESLFYLMARGIPADAARTLLLNAFASEIAADLPQDPFRQEVERRITERLGAVGRKKTGSVN